MAEPIDTLVEGSFVVTMNERREVLTDAAVAIRASQIIAVDKTATLLARTTPASAPAGRASS